MAIRPVNEANPNAKPQYDGFRSANENTRPVGHGVAAALYDDPVGGVVRLTKVKLASK